MLSEQVIEKLVERLVERIESANQYVLKKIGSDVKKLGTLSLTDAQRLAQILKYGGSYEQIVKKLAETTNLNEKEIYEIFDKVAKQNYVFAEQFYKYRGIDYIPYEQNDALRNQIRAIAKITADQYTNLSKTTALGFGVTDPKTGQITFKTIKQTYDQIIDEAILNVGQGKQTFDEAMYQRLKQIGSGLKVVYPTTYIDKNGNERNYTRRLDSAVRMNLKDGLRELHNNTQQIFGEQFNSNGVEISVHLNPAPDHAEVQGRQFTNEQFDNFQNDRTAISYNNIVFPPEFEGHDRRSIAQYNCYHYVFSIVLGVSEPEYTDSQLAKIIRKNNEGFEFEGKHYTNYEGTQLQRRIETEIRKQKDLQILGRSSDNQKLIFESQTKITQLTNKYKQLVDASNLPSRKDRMRVSGYRRVKVNRTKIKEENK